LNGVEMSCRVTASSHGQGLKSELEPSHRCHQYFCLLSDLTITIIFTAVKLLLTHLIHTVGYKIK